MPQPHPSHLPIPGKPHYHIWGSTSHVHPQGTLLGLAPAWSLIPYLCGTPLFTNGASMPPLHLLHPPFSLVADTYCWIGPYALYHIFLLFGRWLTLWSWTLPGPLELGDPTSVTSGAIGALMVGFLLGRMGWSSCSLPNSVDCRSAVQSVGAGWVSG
jgi:hypothetical protein